MPMWFSIPDVPTYLGMFNGQIKPSEAISGVTGSDREGPDR